MEASCRSCGGISAGSLDWHTPSDKWDVGLFVNNLFNKRHVISEGNDTTDVFGTPYATITPPRVLGLEFRIKF
jgi:iron complex outermembrane receptor protein